MAYQQKPDTGTLFINDNREKETHAHWQGSALINGVEYWVNEWNVTTDRDGNPLPKDKYRKNLGFKRKDSQKAPNPQKDSIAPDGPEDPFDDSLPF